MTLFEIIECIKDIAYGQTNIGQVVEGDVYNIMNSKGDVKYASIVLTQGQHSQDEVYDNYQFTIFYIDRLVDNLETNRLQIQSIGKEIIANIIHILETVYDIEFDTIQFQPFTQKFLDECAGMYTTITLKTPKEVICDTY